MLGLQEAGIDKVEEDDEDQYGEEDARRNRQVGRCRNTHAIFLHRAAYPIESACEDSFGHR